MRKKGKIGEVVVGAVLIMLLGTSCFKQDKKVVLPPPGQNQVTTLSMGPSYETQIYFDLANGVVDSNLFAAWDLAFESSPSGYHVFMSGGKDMFIANMHSTSFTNITDTVGAHWRWDEASWNPDSTAVGNWISYNPSQSSTSSISKSVGNRIAGGYTALSSGNVYLVDRGPNYAGKNEYYKVVFQSVNQSTYTFKYALLDNSFIDSTVLQKDPNENYTYFTFDNGGAPIVMEPGKTSWDIIFTRYRHIFYTYTPPLPYLVTGVLLNLNGDKAALDSIQPYDLIDYNYAKNIPLTTEREIIGYDWKVYSFSPPGYTLRTNYTYIIEDQNGFYWKLKFLGFYNAAHEEGYPQFEYQRLGL